MRGVWYNVGSSSLLVGQEPRLPSLPHPPSTSRFTIRNERLIQFVLLLLLFIILVLYLEKR